MTPKSAAISARYDIVSAGTQDTNRSARFSDQAGHFEQLQAIRKIVEHNDSIDTPCQKLITELD